MKKLYTSKIIITLIIMTLFTLIYCNLAIATTEQTINVDDNFILETHKILPDTMVTLSGQNINKEVSSIIITCSAEPNKKVKISNFSGDKGEWKASFGPFENKKQPITFTFEVTNKPLTAEENQLVEKNVTIFLDKLSNKIFDQPHEFNDEEDFNAYLDKQITTIQNEDKTLSMTLRKQSLFQLIKTSFMSSLSYEQKQKFINLKQDISSLSAQKKLNKDNTTLQTLIDNKQQELNKTIQELNLQPKLETRIISENTTSQYTDNALISDMKRYSGMDYMLLYIPSEQVVGQFFTISSYGGNIVDPDSFDKNNRWSFSGGISTGNISNTVNSSAYFVGVGYRLDKYFRMTAGPVFVHRINDPTFTWSFSIGLSASLDIIPAIFQGFTEANSK